MWSDLLPDISNAKNMTLMLSYPSGINTLYNVCSVHRRIFSTSGGVQYIGGYHEYIGGIMSTSEGYHEYIGECSVHQRDIMSTLGGYHEYIGGCSVHQGISWYMWGDTMSTLGDVQYIGGYHEYIGGISWVHRGMFSTSGDIQYIGVFKEIERILSSCSPTCIMISLRCTEHPLMYSWYPPDVLMVSLRCTEHPPMYSWYPPTFIMISPDVLNIPPMYSWYPPMYSWYPPDVLMVSPRCTHGIPPMYSWYPPDVLNIPRCTEHTLYRVIKGQS